MQMEAPFLSFFHCARPLYLERPRDRVTRERIDEIRNADHDRTIGINCVVRGRGIGWKYTTEEGKKKKEKKEE